MGNLLSRMWASDEGQGVVEYAVMLTLILLVSVSAVHGIGSQVSDMFESVEKVFRQKPKHR